MNFTDPTHALLSERCKRTAMKDPTRHMAAFSMSAWYPYIIDV